MSTLDKSAVAFQKLYQGQRLLVKVGGAELQSPEFSTFISDVRSLVAQGTYVTIVFGGGPQIDEQWERRHATPRPKREGIGVTSEAVLSGAILPAYRQIKKQLTQALRRITIVDPQCVQCHLSDRHGLVWDIRRIHLPLDVPLSAVGFLGTVDRQTVNVNADQVVCTLVEGYRTAINEVILLTGTGGVLNREGAIVPLLTKRSITEILTGQHADVACDGGMRKKLEEVAAILACVGKAVITRIADLREEIESWQGKGTMCVNEDVRYLAPLQRHEESIFAAVNDHHVERGIFRPRTPAELLEIKRHHDVLRVGNSLLGGFSLLPRDGGWLELAAFWSGYLRNGIGGMLVEELRRRASGAKVYALTTQSEMKALLERGGFRTHGTIRESQASPPAAHLPSAIARYDASERNPWVLTSLPDDRVPSSSPL